MHKDTMMGLCLMAVLGAVVLEVNASPDEDAISMLPDFASDGSIFEKQCMKIIKNKTNEKFKNWALDIQKAYFKLRLGFKEQELIRLKIIKTNDEKSWDELDFYIDKNCKKATEVLGYFKELRNLTQVCFTAELKQNLTPLSRNLESLVRFQCSLSRNEIAPFNEDTMGVCPNFTRDAMKNCYQSLPYYTSGNNSEFIKGLMRFSSTTFCVDLQRFESCFFHHLESCTDNTPVLMGQSIFKLLKNEMDCQALNATNVTDSSKPNANNTLASNGNGTIEHPTNVADSSGSNVNNTMDKPGNSTGGGATNPSQNPANGGSTDKTDSSKEIANNTLASNGNGTIDHPTNAL